MNESYLKLEYATRLLEAASSLKSMQVQEHTALIYLSFLSTLISIQAVLECAGVSSDRIQECCRSPSDTLRLLKNDNLQTTLNDRQKIVEIEHSNFNNSYPNATVGEFLLGVTFSDHPGELVIGSSTKKYPSGIVLDLARHMESWARESIKNNSIDNT